MSWGGHIVDRARAETICAVARAAVGLAASKDWRTYERFLDPFDTEAHQRGFAFGYPHADPPIPPQSCCTKFILAVAREAGKDGTIDHEGQRRDVLRVPQASGLVGDSPTLAQKLGEQNGLLEEPSKDERPVVLSGHCMLIGGDDGLPPSKRIYGGRAHGIVVVDVLEDGTLATVEGGRGPGGTAIEACRRELHHYRGGWWVRDAGTLGAGRMLRWMYAMGELPDVR